MSGNLTFEVAYDVLPANEPSAGDWTDLTSKVTEPVGTGIEQATVILEDLDRALDPTAAGTSRLVRHARLIGHANSLDLPVWRGLTDDWSPVWQTGRTLVQVMLVDGLAWCGLQDEDVDLEQQYSHERISALLDLAGWPAGLRDIGTGKVLLEPVEQAGANLRRQMEDAVAGEDGDLWVAPDGKITFRGRHARLALTSQATLGGSGIPLATGLQPRRNTHRLTNIVRVELADGTTFTQSDQTSIDNKGPRTDSIRDLALPWYEANGLADWDVTRFKDEHTWLDAVTVEVSDEDDLQTVLGLRRGDRVEAVVDLAGTETTVDGHIEFIGHDIVKGRWLATFDLSPYFGAGPWFTLGHATLGILGGGNRLAP